MRPCLPLLHASESAVKTGIQENDLVEVITDLKENTPIVTQGAYSLRTPDGSLQQTRIKILEDKP